MTTSAGLGRLPPFDAWWWLRAWNETWIAGASAAAARSYRAQRSAELLEQALQGSPLWRRHAGGAKALQDMPPIDKPALMAQFDDWATDRRITRAAAADFLANPARVGEAFLGRYLLWTSSGTSGVPGWFVQDARSLAAYDAIDALRLRGAAPNEPALGAWGLGERFAFVAATGGHFAGIVSMERLRRIVPPPWRPVITLHSAQRPLRQIAAELQQQSPTVLITYPSCAVALAQLQREGSLALRLREVWLGGEQATPAQRSEIALAFGASVRINYGASECFSIAWECSHGQLHLNDDWVILEPVDERLQPVPPGMLSHTALLTNLANAVQPLIRYRLDDRVRVLPQPCPCGSAFTAIEVQGRNADTLQLRDVHHHRVAILPLALETAIEEGAGVTQFQVIGRGGRGEQTLELRFEPDVHDVQAAFKRCRGAIGEFLASHGVQHTRVVLSRQAPLRERASGKLQRVKRLEVRPAHHP